MAGAAAYSPAMTALDPDVTWYKDFFDGDAYLTLYASRLNDRETRREVEMVERALQLDTGARILDLACGTGRHSVRLARHGYKVTSVDLNEGYLQMAKEAAAQAGVEIATRACDMRQLRFDGEFDAVVSLFTSFGYFQTDEEDMQVLDGVVAALKPGGRYLIDVGNREWQLQSPAGKWGDGPDGATYFTRRDFDPVMSILTTIFYRAAVDEPLVEMGRHGIRLYTMTELLRMLRQAGLVFSRSYGNYRGREYDVRSPRMIIVARKPA